MIYVQVILSLVARLAWKIHQMNVKSTFLHGDLSEEIYMEQPPSFMTYSTLVWRLQKLYGLKYAPQAWYAKIDSFFRSLGFKHCEYDHNIYVLHVHGDILIVVIYVDDLVRTGNNIWSNFWIEETTCCNFCHDKSWYFALFSWPSKFCLVWWNLSL